jgi:hypothetical protein
MCLRSRDFRGCASHEFARSTFCGMSCPPIGLEVDGGGPVMGGLSTGPRSSSCRLVWTGGRTTRSSVDGVGSYAVRPLQGCRGGRRLGVGGRSKWRFAQVVALAAVLTARPARPKTTAGASRTERYRSVGPTRFRRRDHPTAMARQLGRSVLSSDRWPLRCCIVRGT